MYARIGNVSEGGLFVRTSTPLPYGSRARLRIGEWLEVNAEVVWAAGEGSGACPGMGLQFEDPTDSFLSAVHKLIEDELAKGAVSTELMS